MTKGKSLLDFMTPEDRAKTLRNAKIRQQFEKIDNVTPEMYVIAEFGYYFGYEGIRAIKNNEIDLDEVHVLIAAARKVWYAKVVDTSHGALVANVAANSRSIPSAFTSGLSSFMKKMKVNT